VLDLLFWDDSTVAIDSDLHRKSRQKASLQRDLDTLVETLPYNWQEPALKKYCPLG
jgi:hypothetical protein